MILATLALIATACHERAPGPYPLFRFIPEEATESFDIGDLVRREEVRQWSFESGERLSESGWQLELPAEASLVETSDHLSFRLSKTAWVALSRPVDLAAETINTLEIEARGLARGRIRIRWGRSGEELASEREIEMSVGRPLVGDWRSYRFPILGHSQWNGTIAHLRLDFYVERNEQVEVRCLRALREDLQEDKLAQALQKPWKVDLANEVRNTLLTLPGLPIERTLTVPARATFRFGYASPAGLQDSMIFRASLARDDGEPTILYENRLSAQDASIWHDASVDLSAYAGESARLILETEMAAHLDPRLGFPMWSYPEVVPGVSSDAPSIVMISVDTLRADHLSLYGYSRSTSPVLEAWAAANATVFDTAVASSPWTLPSHVSMLSGLNAHRHGVNYNHPTPSEMTLLAELMRQAGYMTVAITGGGYLHPQWGFTQGFDRYLYFAVQMGFADELEKNLDRALKVLEANSDRPIFLFFHTYEVHNPYRPRQPYISEFGAEEDRGVFVRVDILDSVPEEGFRGRRGYTVMKAGKEIPKDSLPAEVVTRAMVALYDSGVAYTDQQLGRLWKALESRDPDRRNVVVLTSDHGELLGEHNVINHLYLYEENLLVPLIIAEPGRRSAGRRVTTQVRSIDIVPTILKLASLDAPSHLDGVSLVPLMRGEETSVPDAWSYAASSNYGISLRVRNRLKYIFDNSVWPSSFFPPEELYDLRKDPRELENLAAGSDQRVTDFRKFVTDHLEKEVSGLRLRFTNALDRPFSGTLKGSMVSPIKVKTSRFDCACLRFDGSGAAVFEVPSGETFTLWGEGTPEGRVVVEIDGVTLSVDLSSIESKRHLILTEEGWKVFDGEPPVEPATGVTIWWHGDRRGEAVTASDMSPELLEQLKALGYF